MAVDIIGTGALVGLGRIPVPDHDDGVTAVGRVRERLMSEYESTWFCKRCGRFCPNCCGRSCTKCCWRLPPVLHDPKAGLYRPTVMGTTHQDSLFQNAFRFKPYYIVHPEWNSEVVADPKAMPLSRPPWAWEQPRYRINMQIPITYNSPVQMDEEDLKKKDEEEEEPHDFSKELPPLSYHLTQSYRSTHPEYVVRF